MVSIGWVAFRYPGCLLHWDIALSSYCHAKWTLRIANLYREDKNIQHFSAVKSRLNDMQCTVQCNAWGCQACLPWSIGGLPAQLLTSLLLFHSDTIFNLNKHLPKRNPRSARSKEPAHIKSTLHSKKKLGKACLGSCSSNHVNYKLTMLDMGQSFSLRQKTFSFLTLTSIDWAHNVQIAWSPRPEICRAARQQFPVTIAGKLREVVKKNRLFTVRPLWNFSENSSVLEVRACGASLTPRTCLFCTAAPSPNSWSYY